MDETKTRCWEIVFEQCDCGGEYGCSHGGYPYELIDRGREVKGYGDEMRPAEIANFTEANDATTEDAWLMCAAPLLLDALKRLLPAEHVCGEGCPYCAARFAVYEATREKAYAPPCAKCGGGLTQGDVDNDTRDDDRPVCEDCYSALMMERLSAFDSADVHDTETRV